MNTRIAFCAVLASALLTIPAADAQIVNGDFSSGFSGWTRRAINHGFAEIDPAPFVNTTTVGGSAAVKLETGAFADNLYRADLYQDIVVSMAEPYLRFDFTLPAVFPDGTGSGASSFMDSFSATVFPNGDLVTIYRDGSMLTGPGFLGISITDSTTPGFDKTLTANLSSYIDAPYTVTLQFSVYQYDDGFLFDPFLDNVQLTAVPEPGSAVAAGAFFCAAFGLGRRLLQRQ